MLGIVFAIAYIIWRKAIGRKSIIAEDVLRGFITGFTLSICVKITQLGYLGSCKELGYSGNVSLLIGGAALFIFALQGFYKSVNKADMTEKNTN